jgi:hypothetical protein
MTAPVLSNYVNGIGNVTGDQLGTFEQTCNTFAQLRAFVGKTGAQVLARGQYVPNDGLGGSFWWNVGSTAVDDNLNVIVPPGSAAGAWNRLTTPAATLVSFNADFLAWWAGLPLSPPTHGPWNDGGTLAVVP